MVYQRHPHFKKGAPGPEICSCLLKHKVGLSHSETFKFDMMLKKKKKKQYHFLYSGNCFFFF